MINSVSLQLKLCLLFLGFVGQSFWELIKVYKVFLSTFLVVTIIVLTQQTKVAESQKQAGLLNQKLQAWHQIKSLQPNSQAIDEYLKTLD
ncbi:MAG: hypothetical protein ABIJ03_00360 [Patescibacteria group bacterium]